MLYAPILMLGYYFAAQQMSLAPQNCGLLITFVEANNLNSEHTLSFNNKNDFPLEWKS